ncbi:MAG: ThuA domain-containing protein [Halococcoides sp.]
MNHELQALLIGDTAFPFHDIGEIGPYIASALESEGVAVDLTSDPEDFVDLPGSDYDVVVDYTTDSDLTDEQVSGLSDFVTAGGGYAGVHGASGVTLTTPDDPDEVVGTLDDPHPELRELVGGQFVDHPEMSAFDVRIVDSHHPITIDLADFRVYDEPYRVETDDVRVLARMDHPEVGDQPVAWVQAVGDGRSFYSSLGHTRRSFEGGPLALLGAGVRWAGRA